MKEPGLKKRMSLNSPPLLRWLLVAWGLVAIGDTVLKTAGPALASGGGEIQAIVDSLSQLVWLIQTLLLALLVSGLVHEEPLVGADAFWLTRPIGRNAGYLTRQHVGILAQPFRRGRDRDRDGVQLLTGVAQFAQLLP